MPRLLITPGVKQIADDHGAYWLIDAIRSHQTPDLLRQCDGFQVWTLAVADDNSALLICRRDTNEPDLLEQHIEFTDYPTGTVKLWVCDGVILTPEEY